MAIAKVNEYNPELSIETNFNAMINWVNWCLREMEIGRVPTNTENIGNLNGITNNLLGNVSGQYAEQFRLAVQEFASTLPEEKAMEIATVYPEWDGNGHAYAINDYCVYGENQVGDPQLYRCLQAHTSQSDWTPDVSVSLFKAIGIAGDDIPVWSQPVGTEDAYMKGDKVHYPDAEGDVYESLIDGNVWSPDDYPQGWEKQ